MLNIYTSLTDVTKDERFIKDVDAFFGSNVLHDDDFTRMVLNRIEKCTEYKDNIFIDRSGVGLYSSFLSTGTKILLSISYYPEYIFNGIEMGYNAAQLLSYVSNGNIYIDNRDFVLEEENNTKCVLCVDGVECSIEEVNDILGG